MFENYEKYLQYLDEKLSKLFENQKDYIFCKKGCAKCCKNAQFSYSKTELLYLMNGFQKLDEKTKNKVRQNVENLKKTYQNNNYDCPFLINNECVVYLYRGIVCRTFGLLEKTHDAQTVKMPFCIYEGLNYSNAFNEKTGEILFTNNLVQPTAFDVGYKILTNKEVEQKFQVKFEATKPLIEWFL